MKHLMFMVLVLVALVVPVAALAVDPPSAPAAPAAPSNFAEVTVPVSAARPMWFTLEGDCVTVWFWIGDGEVNVFKPGTTVYLAGPLDWPYGDIEAKMPKMPKAMVEGRVLKFPVKNPDGTPYLKETKFVAFTMVDATTPEYLDVVSPEADGGFPELSPYITEYGKPGIGYKVDFGKVRDHLKAGLAP